MGEEASFVTVEIDDDRAAASARLFADRPNVRVLHGDWHEVLPPEAPFDLLFFDGGGWKRSPPAQMRAESERALDLVSAGGVVAMDNLTPEDLWLPDGPTGRTRCASSGPKRGSDGDGDPDHAREPRQSSQ